MIFSSTEVCQGASAGFHLHPADVYREYCGEEEHLQEEVRHEAHDGKQAKLLQHGDRRQKSHETNNVSSCHKSCLSVDTISLTRKKCLHLIVT